MERSYTWRDPAPLAGALVTWLYLDLAANLFSGVASLMHFVEARPLPADLPTEEASLPSDLFVGVSALLLLITIFSAGFLVLKWIYRVSRNAHAAAPGLATTPPWAVGWFFIPFACLWKPFQSLRDVWRVSADPVAWRTARTPSLLRWWWGLWLVTSILEQASFRISLSAQTVAGTLYVDLLDMLTAVLTVPLNLLLIQVVRRLTAMQSANLTGAQGRSEMAGAPLVT